MIITGIHTPAIQRARMLAQGIAPLTLGKWVSERSLSYRQCRAWLLDYAKLDTEADFFCSSVPYALRRLATMQRRKSLRSWNRWCRRQLGWNLVNASGVSSSAIGMAAALLRSSWNLLTHQPGPSKQMPA